MTSHEPKLLRPRRRLALLLAGVPGLVAPAWISASTIALPAPEGEWPLRTGFWFWFALVFIVPAGAAYGAAFCCIARRWGGAAGWVGLGLVSAMLTALALRSALPAATLRRALGEHAAAVATIERLRTWQTFNDGPYAMGVVSGPPDLVERIRLYHALPAEPLRGWPGPSPFPTEADVPADIEVYRHRHGWIASSESEGLVYFFYRWRLPPGRSESAP